MRRHRVRLAALAASVVVMACGSSHPNTSPEPRAAMSKDSVDSDVPLEVQLQAKAGGLVIVPGVGGIEIRGPATFMGQSAPLYIVDGLPWTGGPNGVLAGLNPHDIASIKVLKNPEDVAIYGIRGGNGVIVITTKKRGAKPD